MGFSFSARFRARIVTAPLILLPLVSGLSRSPAAEVTWNADIAPLMNRHCVKCHRPGQIGPMSLLSYEDARPWARSIREAVVNRTMPPWHADPEVGSWANDPSLTPEQIEVIRRWADEGALRGEAAGTAPSEPPPSGEWLAGEPDLIIEAETPVILGKDFKDDTLYRVADCGFSEDKWIRTAEYRPSDSRFAHHAIIFVLPNEVIRKHSGNPGAFFNFNRMMEEATVIMLLWTPGSDPRFCPEGQGIRIPADSSIVFDLHYHKDEPVEARDIPRLALQLCEGPVRNMAMPLLINSADLVVPPRAARHENVERLLLEHDTEIQSLILHMHYRGSGAELLAHLPGGEKRPLLRVPKYDFNWQHTYYPSRPIRLPAGTELVATAWFDNSAGNPRNPDPDATVRFGPESDDEMMSILMDAIRPNGMPAPIEVLLADNLVATGYPAEAKLHYAAAIRDDPSYPTPHNNLGLLLMKENDLEGAARSFETALKLQPDFGHARLNHAECLIGMGRTQEAERELARLLAESPGTAGVGYNLGNLYLTRQNYAEAIRCYQLEAGARPAGKTNPAAGAHGLPLGDYHFNFGMALFMDGRYPPAVIQFEKAARINPSDAAARNYLGMAVASTGNLQGAVRHFRDALKLKPDYSDARANLERAEGFLRQSGTR